MAYFELTCYRIFIDMYTDDGMAWKWLCFNSVSHWFLMSGLYFTSKQKSSTSVEYCVRSLACHVEETQMGRWLCSLLVHLYDRDWWNSPPTVCVVSGFSKGITVSSLQGSHLGKGAVPPTPHQAGSGWRTRRLNQPVCHSQPVCSSALSQTSNPTLQEGPPQLPSLLPEACRGPPEGGHLDDIYPMLVTQSCPTLCDPMGCSPPGK